MIISVRTNIDEFTRALNALNQKQIPFAAARALNDTATLAQARVTAALPQIFDRPTPFTKRAVQVVRASKSDLRAMVTLRPLQAQYLRLEEVGGVRTGAMNTRNPAAALIMPEGVKLNPYGNIPSGAVPRLRGSALAVSQKRQANVAARAGALKGSKRAAAKAVYSGTVYIKGGTPQAHGHPGGFYKLSKFKLFPILLFAPQAQYKPRFGFHKQIGAVVSATFNEAMARRLVEAIRTQRP